MRLYIDYDKLEEVLINAIGVYKTYKWNELPEGYFPVIALSNRSQLFVALSHSQFNEFLSCIIENARRIYVVHSSIIDTLAGESRLADCLERERKSDGTTPDLSDPDALMAIYHNMDGNVRELLENDYKDIDAEQFNTSLQNAINIYGRDSIVVGKIVRFMDTIKFCIRHASSTKDWTDRSIDAHWDDIVKAVIAKAIEQKSSVHETHEHHEHSSHIWRAFRDALEQHLK